MKGEAVNEAARMIKFIMALGCFFFFIRERPVVQAAGGQRRAAPHTAGQHIERCSRPSIDCGRASTLLRRELISCLGRERTCTRARTHTQPDTESSCGESIARRQSLR